MKTLACHGHLRKYSLLETTWSSQDRWVSWEQEGVNKDSSGKLTGEAWGCLNNHPLFKDSALKANDNLYRSKPSRAVYNVISTTVSISTQIGAI